MDVRRYKRIKIITEDDLGSPIVYKLVHLLHAHKDMPNTWLTGKNNFLRIPNRLGFWDHYLELYFTDVMYIFIYWHIFVTEFSPALFTDP